MGTKHYKPGQIVTIDHRRYRIKKHSEHPCYACVFERNSAAEQPCLFCLCHFEESYLYLEPIEAQIQIKKRLCGSQVK